MALPLFQVDAFTDRPFAGNPAAVCLLDGPRDARWMQQVAAEMNLSETAFVLPRQDGWELRWFTPTTEVDLCGHATLASAHVLWETGHLAPDRTARFHTRSGLLTATRRDGWIELDFPCMLPEAIAPPAGLAEALGVAPRQVARVPLGYLVEVEHAAQVRHLRPDRERLCVLGVEGVIVTSRGDDAPYQIVSRFFAPAIGIDEDPVTGAAHCALAPYWSARLGTHELLAYQASARGGVVRVRLAGERVRLGGQAVTVLRGTLVDDVAA